MSLPPDAEQFLKRVRQGLSTLEEKERDEIVNELRSHLLDRQAQNKADLLQGFEPPEILASAFLSEYALRGALAQGTSWAMGRALLIAARDSALVLLILFPLILLQICGAGFIALGLLKPLLPNHIGIWVGGGNLNVGFTSPSPGCTRFSAGGRFRRCWRLGCLSFGLQTGRCAPWSDGGSTLRRLPRGEQHDLVNPDDDPFRRLSDWVGLS
jgi:HAAS domain-containing protein